MDSNFSRELSRTEIIWAFVGVVLALAPIVLVSIFHDNEYVQLVLGNWRIFVFYAVAVPAFVFLEKKLKS